MHKLTQETLVPNYKFIEVLNITIDAALREASLPQGLTTFTETWLAGRTNSEYNYIQLQEFLKQNYYHQ